MDGLLVLVLAVSLSFCLGTSLKTKLGEPGNGEDNAEKTIFRKISKLLEERTSEDEAQKYESVRHNLNTPKDNGLAKRTEQGFKDCFECGYSKDYRGKVSTTISGRKCQYWNTNEPHDPYYKPEEADDLASNYCRDLDSHGVPWCYTEDEDVRWENCAVPICTDDCFEYGKSNEYRGPTSKTISGRRCQSWYSDKPHKRNYHPPCSSDLYVSNVCLDPSNDGAPWCYTEDENVRWEYCGVPVC